MKNYYVYALFHPVYGHPIYIGKGKDYRINVHEYLGENHPNILIRNTILKYRCDLPKAIIKSNISEEEAFLIEKEFIKAIGRKPNGSLYNMTDGGEGCSIPKSEAHKDKISASLIGHEVPIETRIKISQTMKGKPWSGHRRKMYEQGIGRKKHQQ